MTPFIIQPLSRFHPALFLGAIFSLVLILSFPTLRSLPTSPVQAVIGQKETTFSYGGLVRGETNPDTGASHEWLDLGNAVIDIKTGAHYFKHFDQRGNVKFITDENGQITTIYGYHAYGVDHVLGDTLLDPNNFATGFATGQTPDDPLIVGARVYDPAVGRFLSEDPVYNPINQYAYTNGNPVNFWDPSGVLSIQFQMSLGPFVNGGIAPNPDMPYGPGNPALWGAPQTASNDMPTEGFNGETYQMNIIKFMPMGQPPPGTTATIFYRVDDNAGGALSQFFGADMPGFSPIRPPIAPYYSHSGFKFNDGTSLDYTKEHGVAARSFQTEGYKVRYGRTDLNAARLKQAASNVEATGKYAKDVYDKLFNNCHDYVDDVLAEYDRLTGP